MGSLEASNLRSAEGSSRSSLLQNALLGKTMYTGFDVAYAARLAAVADGGQILLTQAAWESMGTELPAGTYVLHLGEHLLMEGEECTDESTEEERPGTAFMQLVPNHLEARVFAPLRDKMVSSYSKGYLDTPEPPQEMASMFVGTHAPDDPLIAAPAVALLCTKLRELLPCYDGYECKEPEPGKFTLCFTSFDMALTFAARLHTDLLHVDWARELLDTPEGLEEWGEEGQLLYRGLRVRVGIAYGTPTTRKPLNTGRADYFGPLPNLAVRCAPFFPLHNLIPFLLLVAALRLFSLMPCESSLTTCRRA
jgi:hypothetical protein